VTLPDIGLLRARLEFGIKEQAAQGHDIEGLAGELRSLPDSYDALDAFATRLAAAPLRPDWRYVEPDDLETIWAEAAPQRPLGAIAELAPQDASARAEAAFLGSVCGCMLGKPLEFDPTLAEIRAALEPAGEWPLRDYLSEVVVRSLRERQGQWRELVRGRITHVAADDDINYTVLGMLALERHGAGFTREQLLQLWLYNLPVLATFGPERTMLANAALGALEPGAPPRLDAWAKRWNPGTELCGALIRADAYGYACLGRPTLAAELAWRDAGMTHRRTGLYGAMFVAAAIAAAPAVDDPLDIFRTALKFVPQRSRFAEAVRFAIEAVASASDWLEGYQRIHDRYGDYSHCRVLQEVGTLVNTLRFAADVGDGICKQVMQGNDTDSFGATCGSILGAWFGPGHLDERWTAPFQDRIQLAMATTWESSLSALTSRMAALPAVVRSAR
jgi:ADP-ribosylglycohydrolase